jgi:hypothetical protein
MAAEAKTALTVSGRASRLTCKCVSYWPAKEAPSRSSAVPEERTAKRWPPSAAAAARIRAHAASQLASAAGVTTKPRGTGKPDEARRARFAAFVPSSEAPSVAASAKVMSNGARR